MARVVSKLLPVVEMVTLSLVAAVQDHHTLWPPATVGLRGSPASLLANTLVPVVWVVPGASTKRSAKLSFGGRLTTSKANDWLAGDFPGALACTLRFTVDTPAGTESRAE